MKKILLLGAVLLLGTEAMAEELDNVNIPINNKWNIELGAQIQNLETNEIVYKNSDDTNDDRLSQLNWRMNNVKMFGGKVSYKPTDRLEFSFGGYTKVGDYNDKMDDYDWVRTQGGSKIDKTDNWDHHTESRTELDKAINLNVGMNYKVYDGRYNDFFILGGVSYTNNKWSPYGFDGKYSTRKDSNGNDLPYNFRGYDEHGDDRELGMTYDQKVFTGDLGIGYEFDYKKVELGLNGIIGLGLTKSVDEHLARENGGIEFKDKMKALKIETTAYIGYNFTKDLNTKLSVTSNVTENLNHGDETARAMDGSGTKDYDGRVGFKNTSLITKLGVNYSF